MVLDVASRVDFDGMRRRGFGQPWPGRLVFVAFDVLALAGEDVMAMRWESRRGILVDLGFDGAWWCTTPSYIAEGRTLFQATRAEGIEGVIAKRLDSPYRPGVRTTAWVKTKHFERAWFDVLGVAPTPGERYALLLGLRKGGHVPTPAGWSGASAASGSRSSLPGGGRRTRALSAAGPRPGDVFEPGVSAEVRSLAASQLRHATLRSLVLEGFTSAAELDIGGLASARG